MTFVESLVEREFVEYLADTLGLEAQDRPQKSEWSRVGNTIGVLTLRMNLMSVAEVDRVLEIQDSQGGYFGEIAVKNRYLTSEQVNRLLEIQQLHDQLDLVEQWVIEGKLDIPSLINRFSAFLGRRDGTGPASYATRWPASQTH
jgi:hypothetical protein